MLILSCSEEKSVIHMTLRFSSVMFWTDFAIHMTCISCVFEKTSIAWLLIHVQIKKWVYTWLSAQGFWTKLFVRHIFYSLQLVCLKYIENKFAQKLWIALFLWLNPSFCHIYRINFHPLYGFPYPETSFNAIYRNIKDHTFRPCIFSIPIAYFVPYI